MNPCIGLNLLYSLLALLAGASFVMQQAVNASLSNQIGSAWWAGFVSYLGGTLVMLVAIILLREPLPAFSAVSRSSWWSWSGGLFGAVYIAVAILLLPRMGAFAVIALIVVGQLAASLLFDHFALFNLPRHPLSASRLLGAAFLLAGAVLIRR